VLFVADRLLLLLLYFSTWLHLLFVDCVVVCFCCLLTVNVRFCCLFTELLSVSAVCWLLLSVFAVCWLCYCPFCCLLTVLLSVFGVCWLCYGPEVWSRILLVIFRLVFWTGVKEKKKKKEKEKKTDFPSTTTTTRLLLTQIWTQSSVRLGRLGHTILCNTGACVTVSTSVGLVCLEDFIRGKEKIKPQKKVPALAWLVSERTDTSKSTKTELKYSYGLHSFVGTQLKYSYGLHSFVGTLFRHDQLRYVTASALQKWTQIFRRRHAAAHVVGY